MGEVDQIGNFPKGESKNLDLFVTNEGKLVISSVKLPICLDHVAKKGGGPLGHGPEILYAFM